MIFESHAHYDDDRFDDDREEVLLNLKDNGVEFVINCGASLEMSRKSVELAGEYDFVYAAVGVHPHDVEELRESDIEVIKNMTDHKKVVAIGEIGLDYYYDSSPREIQREWFTKQLMLANELKLPVIIHAREADQETFDIIKENFDLSLGGVIHCFSGSAELAHEYVKMGFYIGVGGIVTYKNAKKLVRVVEEVGLEHILVETDCPYLSPEPNRGTRNDSTNLKYIVAKIAELKGVDPEIVTEITNLNARKLFRI